MHFENMHAFWHMDGYAIYVWLSYAVSAVSIAGLWINSVWVKHQLFTNILTEQTRQKRIKAATAAQNQAKKQPDLLEK
jgi:heme exporter protein D